MNANHMSFISKDVILLNVNQNTYQIGAGNNRPSLIDCRVLLTDFDVSTCVHGHVTEGKSVQ